MALLAQPDYEDYPGNHGISIFLNDPAHPGQLRAPVTYLPANPTQFDPGISVGNFTGTKSLDIVTTTAGNYGTGDNVLVLPSDPAHPRGLSSVHIDPAARELTDIRAGDFGPERGRLRRRGGGG